MPRQKSANEYDRILKENFVLDLLDVFKVALGIQHCELDRQSDLSSGKLQSTIEREPDFVRVMRQPDGSRFILHIEFQTANETDMLLRMQEYHALLQRKVNLPIRHFVIYLGRKKSTMATQIAEENAFTGFELKNVGDYNPEVLLRSTIPEEIILAILGDFADAKPEIIIKKILARLQELSATPTKLRKYIKQLTVLSRLRNLEEETIKYSKNMALNIDIRGSYVYRKGVEEGVQKGIQKGIQKGMQKEKKAMLQTARKLKKLGVDIAIIAKSTGLTVEEVEKL